MNGAAQGRGPGSRGAILLVAGAALVALVVLLARRAPRGGEEALGKDPAPRPTASAPQVSGAAAGPGEREALPPADAAAELEAAASAPPVSDQPAADGLLRGRVIDEARAPLAGARVAARFLATREFSMLDLELKKTEREVASGVTDADGRFALRVPAAHPLDLVATFDGYATSHARQVYAGEERELVLVRACTFTGRVVRKSGGAGVAGAPMRGWSAEDRRELFAGESGPDGRFTFDDLPAGPMTFEVEPLEHAANEWTTVELVAGELLERTIELEDGVTVFGRVTDASSGAPIGGAEVWEGWFGRKRVRTEPDGTYRLRGFGGWGVYDVHVHAAGFGNVAHEFPYTELPTEDTELDFALSPARRARGRVVDRAGAPVADAYVAALHSSFGTGDQVTDWEATRTDADGGYVLPSLHPELTHTLFVRKEGHGTVLYDFPPDELEVREVVLPDAVLPSPARIEGRVVDEVGAPRAGLKVQLDGWNADYLLWRDGSTGGMDQGILDGYVGERSSRTDSIGRFQFADLAPGSYVLEVRPEGRQDGSRQRIEVAEGEWVRELEVVLARGLSITGRVTASDGRGLVGVLVRAEGVENGLEATATTGAGGAFELLALEPGPYDLRADPLFLEEEGEAERYAELEHTGVAAGARDVEFVLPIAVLVSGIVLGADGQPYPRAFVFAKNPQGRQVDWDIAGSDGRFSFRAAGGVPLTVEAHPSKASESSPFGVDPIGGEDDRAFSYEVRPPVDGLVLTLPSHSG